MCAHNALPGGTCMQHDADKKTYNLQLCPAGETCNAGLFSESAKCITTPAPIVQVLPGDTCATKDDCEGSYNTCSPDKICKGNITGQKCNDQPDCEIGYTCQNVPTNAVCQPMKQVGQACGDYMTNNLCVNGAVCDNGLCVTYLSKPNGSIVDLINASSLCESGFWVTSTSYPTKAICTEAPRSPNNYLPLKCDPGTYCYSDDAKWAIKCACGFNETGQGYCPLFPGDDHYQTYLQALKEYATVTNLASCHYLDQGQRKCGASQEVFDRVAETLKAAHMFPYLQGNDDCVSNIITG